MSSAILGNIFSSRKISFFLFYLSTPHSNFIIYVLFFAAPAAVAVPNFFWFFLMSTNNSYFILDVHLVGPIFFLPLLLSSKKFNNWKTFWCCWFTWHSVTKHRSVFKISFHHCLFHLVFGPKKFFSIIFYLKNLVPTIEQNKRFTSYQFYVLNYSTLLNNRTATVIVVAEERGEKNKKIPKIFCRYHVGYWEASTGL